MLSSIINSVSVYSMFMYTNVCKFNTKWSGIVSAHVCVVCVHMYNNHYNIAQLHDKVELHAYMQSKNYFAHLKK